jgi:hypothetical protein
MSVNGMEVINPSHSSTSGGGGGSYFATKSGLGKITFGNCGSIALDNVFSSTYDNYYISFRCFTSSTATSLALRFRLNGTPDTGTNYSVQNLNVSGATVVSASGSSQTYADFGQGYGTRRVGYGIYIFSPFLAQPTAFRSIGISDLSSAYLSDWAGYHTLSNAYNGIVLYPGAGYFDGELAVYGFVK